MLFSSFEFIFFFLPVAVIGYYSFNYARSALWGKLWLLSCSLFFYGWWNPAYLPLLMGSIFVNYFISRLIVSTGADSRPKLRLAYFVLGVAFNIFLLGYFKYANFFVDNINFIFQKNYFVSKIALPLGISFFSIQQIAFLMDTYEDIAEEKFFFDYCLFVTFFPHLLAGPILHHKQMMPQFSESKVRFFDAKNFSIGFFLLSLGLFKKVIVADPLSVWVSSGYSLQGNTTFIDAWVTSLSYTFQLYFDFSGYVDMAIGISFMFNIILPKNFDSPYKATSIINFWERWHITLSKFITTYIYTPLVRIFPGRVTFSKSMLATLVAMFIAGLWHGAAWSYVLFGLFHGVGLVINHIWRRRKIKIYKWLSWMLTFVFVNISFIIFRANGIDSAMIVIKAMFGIYNSSAGSWFDLHAINMQYIQHIPLLSNYDFIWLPKAFSAVVLSSILFVCLFCKNSSGIYDRFQPSYGYALLQVFMIVTSLFMMNGVTEFVYFQF